MKISKISWTPALLAIIVAIIFSVFVIGGDAEEASLRCSRCPATCASAHSYQVSCHNACRSLSPRLTQVRCESNRCYCSEPATTSTTARSTTTKKKKFFG